MSWLELLRADALFAFRRLRKSKVTSAAAVLSLALAIGACASAFRLVDALLLRPLPIAHPERLYTMSRTAMGLDNKPNWYDSWPGPSFLLMRAAAKGEAELVAASYTARVDVTYASDEEMEKAQLQYVSGWMFAAFGLRPALGRLLTEADDRKPVAVLSYDYWTQRFARDPKVLGRTFHLGNEIYQIVGVGPESFTGTETGTVTGVFVPITMNPSFFRGDASWFRTLVMVNPGVAVEPLRQKLAAVSHAFERERSKGFINMPQRLIDRFLNESISLDPAPAGVSRLQRNYRESLIALGVLVALVLLIACANVANLMTAQAAARAREMALRISLGARRWRLAQLVLVESAWIALLASAGGLLFSEWSAPLVVRMINPPDNPARLELDSDWRVLIFEIALTLAVTFLFGLAPALRASATKPAAALKGENPHSRGRLMRGLIAVQVSFCFLVMFVAGLFVASFERLSHQPTGFSSDRLLVLDTVTSHAQTAAAWNELADGLRETPGVEAVALADWPLLSGFQHNNFLSINGGPPTQQLAFFLNVSPEWRDTMKIPLLDGRDLRPDDIDPGAVLVNQTFAKTFFNGENPVGKTFEAHGGPFEIVGLVGDALYTQMREVTKPVVYAPFLRKDPIRGATMVVRTSGPNPLALAPALRRDVPHIRAGFRVSNLRTQQELNESWTVRERLLAMLALFFAAVALILAGVGLYGVLNYSVVERWREIGIRLAIGAPSSAIARLVTLDVLAMVAAGAVAGVALGLTSVHWLEALFYRVKATDATMLMLPALTILGCAVLAAVPAVVRAVRIDPVETLRAE